MVFLGGAFPSFHSGNFGGPGVLHFQFVILPHSPPIYFDKILILGRKYIFKRIWYFTNMFSHPIIFGIVTQKSMWVSPNPSKK